MTNVSKEIQETKPAVKDSELLRITKATEIASLDISKSRFIENYNLTHKSKDGSLMYHRQLIHFNQIIANNPDLKECDGFTLYACFLTAAVNGDSFDPHDEETYLIPLKGKAYLWPQTKALVKRLRNSGQVKYADQVKLVYKGDIFEMENGKVKKHVEKFETEIIIAGYIRFVIDDAGTDKFFIYRKSDWEAWKNKSSQKGGENWSGGIDKQPMAAFLRTKIAKHACKDKSWASGNRPTQFNIEIEDPAEAIEDATAEVLSSSPLPSSPEEENAATSFIEESKEEKESVKPQATIVHESNEERDGF
jgi:recombinational DNA repair protein RecT